MNRVATLGSLIVVIGVSLRMTSVCQLPQMKSIGPCVMIMLEMSVLVVFTNEFGNRVSKPCNAEFGN